MANLERRIAAIEGRRKGSAMRQPDLVGMSPEEAAALYLEHIFGPVDAGLQFADAHEAQRAYLAMLEEVPQ